MKYNEDTGFDSRKKNDEGTVADNISTSEDTVVENGSKPAEPIPAEKESKTVKVKSNNGKRVAVAVAGAAVAGAAVAGVAAAGTAAAVYFMNNGEEEPAEDVAAEPAAEPSETAKHADQEPQLEPQPEMEPTPEPVSATEPAPKPKPTTHAPEPQPEPVPAPEPEPALEPEPTPEPALKLQPAPESEPEVVVEPEVEILGVEVVHTDEGDMTLGGMTVNGEEYVLVDVNGGDFDIAWHDDNHDLQVQESELTDISGVHISVNDFVQAANHNCEGLATDTEDHQIADSMDSMNPGETDCMDVSDTSYPA